VVTQHAACALATTDPRVSGDMTADLTTTFEPAGSGAGSWQGTFTIVNDGGTWSGTGLGAAVRVAGASERIAIYGRDVYRGAGGYAGFRYTELMAGGDQAQTIFGWVTEPPLPIRFASTCAASRVPG